MTGRSINDRLLAARHSFYGHALEKSVCKATTEVMIRPKKKHLEYLVQSTNELSVSIPDLANLLIERTKNANWVVVYKSLLTIHHLLAAGNERFMVYLASCNATFNLCNLVDTDTGIQVKQGKEEGSLSTMNTDKLLSTLPALQAQLDVLLEFDCAVKDLTSDMINMCFKLLFRDLTLLLKSYNDGIINLLDKCSDMNMKQCKDALALYEYFLVQINRVGEMLKVAESGQVLLGINKGQIPDLSIAPSTSLETLTTRLILLRERKESAANASSQSSAGASSVETPTKSASSFDEPNIGLMIVQELKRIAETLGVIAKTLGVVADDFRCVKAVVTKQVVSSPRTTFTHSNGASQMYFRSNSIIERRYIRSIILPPLKDVQYRPEVGNELRNQLCRFLTTPATQVRDLTAELLFVICKENVCRMTKYTGYGSAADLFANRGLLGGHGAPSMDYSSDSEDSDTEEYKKIQHAINPVLGCYEPPRTYPFAGMTDEQKEYEATKLVNLMNQLNRQGVVQPCRIGSDGRPEAVEHILELQEGIPQQQMDHKRKT